MVYHSHILTEHTSKQKEIPDVRSEMPEEW